MSTTRERESGWIDPRDTIASVRDHVQDVDPGLVLRARLTYGSVTIEYAGPDTRKLDFYGKGGGYYDTRFKSVRQTTQLLDDGLVGGECLKREGTND